MDASSVDGWPGDEATARLIYDEARRLRELQDGRVDEIRKRSMTLLSFVGASVALIAGFADKHSIHRWALLVAVGAVGVMVLSGIVVQLPQGKYTEGPNVHELTTIQYAERHPTHQVLRDLAYYHYLHYHSNNAGVLLWVQRAFAVELLGAGVAVSAVVVGVLA